MFRRYWKHIRERLCKTAQSRKPGAQAEARGADIKSMSFEAGLQELEQIVTRLERGHVDMEQSIGLIARPRRWGPLRQLLKRAESEKVERIALSARGIPGHSPLDMGANGSPATAVPVSKTSLPFRALAAKPKIAFFILNFCSTNLKAA